MRPLWRENGSVIYCTIASGPCQSNHTWAEVPQNSRPYLTFPTWRARFPYLYPPGTGWPSYTPGHWVPFLSPLTTRGDYGGSILTRLLTGKLEAVLELELEFFLWPTVSRPVSLGIGPPFGTLEQILSCSSFVWQLRRSAFNASSLTRKRVCNLLLNCFWALPQQSHLKNLLKIKESSRHSGRCSFPSKDEVRELQDRS
jgi:hypothetical protein